MPTQTKKAPSAATVDAPAKNTSPSILKLNHAVRQAPPEPSKAVACYRDNTKEELDQRLEDFRRNASLDEIHFLNRVLDFRETHHLGSEPLGLVSAAEFTIDQTDYSCYLKIPEKISVSVWEYAEKLATAAGIELTGKEPASSGPLDGLDEGDLEFVRACLEIDAANCGCITPAEEFITSIILRYRANVLDLKMIELAVNEYKTNCEMSEAAIRSHARHHLKEVEAIVAEVKATSRRPGGQK